MDNIFNSIEKIFRFFVPGFLFVYLMKLSSINIEKLFFKNIGVFELIVSIYAIGMLIYAFYRMFLTVLLEPVLFKANMTAVSNFGKSKKIKFGDYPKAFAGFIKARYTKTEKNLSGYLHCSWSIVNYMFICAWMLFIFTLISGQGSLIRLNYIKFMISSIILIILSSVFLLIMYSIEKSIIESKK